ncbi:type III-B CRISPR module-associated Cmr3 family protein [Spirochaeta dissipatitropha]
MRFSLATNDQLIFRDGKPFGDAGVFGGSARSWILPQTITGMVRSAIGLSRSPEYFKITGNRDKILDVGVERILNYVNLDSERMALSPLPADMVFTKAGSDGRLFVFPLEFRALARGCGTDIPNHDWLYPVAETQEKPAKNLPSFLYWRFMEKYWSGDLKQGEVLTVEEMGIGSVIKQYRVHNGIDRDSGVSSDGKLFSNSGIYLAARAPGDESTCLSLSTSFSVTGMEKTDIMPSEAYLGGERKTVQIRPDEDSFPPLIHSCAKKKFLKIVLATHGNFDSWCPSWLMPDLNKKEISFVTIPGTDYSVRLRSACIPGWEPISGWNFAAGKGGAPKAMKKMVKPGAVYLLEIEKSQQSEEIAKYFWGGNLCGQDEHKEGYGLTFTAVCDKQISSNL